jgi:hypothetical protein
VRLVGWCWRVGMQCGHAKPLPLRHPPLDALPNPVLPVCALSCCVVLPCTALAACLCSQPMAQQAAAVMCAKMPCRCLRLPALPRYVYALCGWVYYCLCVPPICGAEPPLGLPHPLVLLSAPNLGKNAAAEPTHHPHNTRSPSSKNLPETETVPLPATCPPSKQQTKQQQHSPLLYSR